MENKEIERDIDKLVRKYIKNSDISLTGSIRGFKITQYIEQLEEENKDLRLRLIASNKFGRKSIEIRQEVEMKLDKYANLLSREVKVATWEYPGGIYMTPNYWKDRCENEKK